MVRGLNAQLIGKIHPKTGKPIVPLGVVGGKLVYPIMGASPDDDSNDDGGDDDNTDDSDSGADDSNNGDGDDDGDGGSDDDNDTKAALERMEKRMKAADQRAAKAEKQLKEIKDAELGDLDKANNRVTELEEENGSLREQLTDLKLNNAFLSANKITWHNPTAAMKLAQSEGYIADVTDDDGNVDEKALGSALTKLAKEHEYLVKPREGAGPSGESHSTRSNNGKDDKATAEADRRRAPALARRR